ncbi:uncharacterized protein LOC134272484 [Saccostrea cucullata]|uniref:uncharacterized protein LOC134272484 n=1 Tax=Saccostrea cuccullata TaxID=36930 RepID=UPI002ED42F08
MLRFPKDAKKRRLWLRALNRDGFVPSEHSCVCSEHFVSGWHSDDPSDENYGSTIFLYKEKPVDAERQSRAARRNIQKDFREAEYRQKEREGKQLSFSLFSHSSYARSEKEEGQDPEREEAEQDDVDIGVKHTRDMGVQCDPDPLLQENMALKAELRRLQGHKCRLTR